MKGIKIIYCFFIAFIFYSCLNEEEMPIGIQYSKKPTVTTEDIQDIGFESATLNGIVEAQNGYDVILRGFYVDTLPNFNNATKIECGKGKGEFTGNISSLISGKEYYACAFAVNEKGTSFGDTISFHTKSNIPRVITSPYVSAIVNGTAICAGRIESEGSDPVIQAGICWGYSENLSIDDSNDSTVYLTGEIPLSEAYDVMLRKIRGGSPCYYRAFAINKKGVGYGDALSFETPPIWTPMEDFPGEERMFPATFTLGDNFYVSTGAGGTGPLQDNQMFQAGYNIWKQKVDFPGVKRRGAIGFSFNDKYGYIGLGATSTGGSLRDIYTYNQSENTWKMTEQNYDSAEVRTLVYAASFVLKNKAYIVGGNTGVIGQPSYETRYEVWQCTPSNNNDTLYWKRMDDFPIKISKHIAFTYNGHAYVGLGEDSKNPPDDKSRDIWIYDPENDKPNTGNPWTLFTSCPQEFVFGQEGRKVVATTTSDGKAYFIGKGDVWELDLITKKWTKKKTQVPDNMEGCIIFSQKNTILMGVNANSNLFYKYEPLWDN